MEAYRVPEARGFKPLRTDPDMVASHYIYVH